MRTGKVARTRALCTAADATSHRAARPDRGARATAARRDRGASTARGARDPGPRIR